MLATSETCGFAQDSQLEASIVSFSAAIAACEAAGSSRLGAQWTEALVLLEELEKQLVEANAVPWPCTKNGGVWSWKSWIFGMAYWQML